MTLLSFIESPVSVRVGEVLIWSFDTTPWHTSPSAPVVSAIRSDTGADVTDTIFPVNAPTLGGTTYTLSPAQGWALDVPVRITAQFSGGGNTFRPYLDVAVSAV